MAEQENRGGIAGISTGGVIVIVGIVLMIVWSFWIGLIIVVVGLIAFGGFARGKWYGQPSTPPGRCSRTARADANHGCRRWHPSARGNITLTWVRSCVLELARGPQQRRQDHRG